MTSITIDLPDDQATALQNKAADEGLTLERWISRQLAFGDNDSVRTVRSPQEAVEHILELQKSVLPDPEGWTSKDYINYGRRASSLGLRNSE